MTDGTPLIPADVFDYETFRRRMLNDDEIIAKLIAGILERMPKMVAELKGYIVGGETQLAGRQAHTIKGAAANLGCELFRRAAFAMESAAETQGIEQLKSLLPALENEWEKLKPILRNTIA